MVKTPNHTKNTMDSPEAELVKDEAAFKALPRLRWRIDEDGCVIAKSAIRKLARDHLYFHGRGVLGIYYERPHPAGRARSYWKSRCRIVIDEQPGEYDGIILFRPTSLKDIPRTFFRRPPAAKPFQPGNPFGVRFVKHDDTKALEARKQGSKGSE